MPKDVKCFNPRSLRCALLMLAVVLSPLAWAHTGNTDVGGFISGFSHPVFGYDHLLAMLAVGMWGAFLGTPAIWMLPVAFPLIMSIGAVFGILGLPLPGVEWGIALSVIALGAAIALAARPPLAAAVLLVSVFAIFHGFAHGQELPEGSSPFSYAAGFVLATGLIHILGIVIGLVVRLPHGATALRAGGVAVAAAGCYFGLQLAI